MEDKFKDMFHTIKIESTRHLPDKQPFSSSLNKWIQDMLEYNLQNGKMNRGLAVIRSYQCLVGDKVKEEDINNALLLGWCIEMLQAFFLMVDDIMDNSTTRRGKPCWYTLKDVGLIALNDGLYIESSIHQLLKRNLMGKQYYIPIVELFNDIKHKTVIGQALDMLNEAGTNFENFTIERYKVIVEFKTAYYTFYLPVGCAMYLAGIEDDAMHEEAKTILLKMGELFQIQDDYLDCFGDPKVTGKIGTDIEENKCSWFVVQALCRSNEQQKLILKENYGCKESGKVETVKELYHELGLPEIYKEEEKAYHSEIMNLIDKISHTLPREMFISYLETFYKRQK